MDKKKKQPQALGYYTLGSDLKDQNNHNNKQPYHHPQKPPTYVKNWGNFLNLNDSIREHLLEEQRIQVRDQPLKTAQLH